MLLSKCLAYTSVSNYTSIVLKTQQNGAPHTHAFKSKYSSAPLQIKKKQLVLNSRHTSKNSCMKRGASTWRPRYKSASCGQLYEDDELMQKSNVWEGPRTRSHFGTVSLLTRKLRGSLL